MAEDQPKQIFPYFVNVVAIKVGDIFSTQGPDEPKIWNRVISIRLAGQTEWHHITVHSESGPESLKISVENKV